MYSYWEVFKEVVKIVAGLVVYTAVCAVVVKTLAWVFTWLFGISHILGWCSLVVFLVFVATTIIYFLQRDDIWN